MQPLSQKCVQICMHARRVTLLAQLPKICSHYLVVGHYVNCPVEYNWNADDDDDDDDDMTVMSPAAAVTSLPPSLFSLHSARAAFVLAATLSKTSFDRLHLALRELPNMKSSLEGGGGVLEKRAK